MSENERSRILEMLKNGDISVEEAERLLSAMREQQKAQEPEPIALKDNRGRKPKKLRIEVDANEEMTNNGKAKVNVNVPVSLIKSLGPIVTMNMFKDARAELEQHGIDLAAILETIQEMIDGGIDEDIVNVDVGENGDAAKVRIYVE